MEKLLNTLEVLVKEDMIENSAKMGAYFKGNPLIIPSPHVKEVRGKGLLVGAEVKPGSGGGRCFCEALQSRGVLAKTAHVHVFIFAPPLIVTQKDLDWALVIIEEVLMMP